MRWLGGIIDSVYMNLSKLREMTERWNSSVADTCGAPHPVPLAHLISGSWDGHSSCLLLLLLSHFSRVQLCATP